MWEKVRDSNLFCALVLATVTWLPSTASFTHSLD